MKSANKLIYVILLLQFVKKVDISITMEMNIPNGYSKLMFLLYLICRNVSSNIIYVHITVYENIAKANIDSAARFLRMDCITHISQTFPIEYKMCFGRGYVCMDVLQM